MFVFLVLKKQKRKTNKKQLALEGENRRELTGYLSIKASGTENSPTTQ